MKKILEKNEINYTKFTIVQASQVKEEWEILNWKINEVTIASIDAVAMYPSIAIPTPKLLIKYHKKLTSMGEFPTRPVIPATNFSATFSKVGYLGLKKILEKNEINYTKFTIVQASHVKEEWEIMNWKRNEVTIASIDAVVTSFLFQFRISHSSFTCDA